MAMLAAARPQPFRRLIMVPLLSQVSRPSCVCAARMLERCCHSGYGGHNIFQ
jgi:hypothetical protein